MREIIQIINFCHMIRHHNLQSDPVVKFCVREEEKKTQSQVTKNY